MSDAASKTQQLRIRKAAGAATDTQLAAINAHTLRPFTADELVVREFVLAHNCIDRDGECFDEGLLQDFAKSLPGKGIFVKHPTGWDGDSGPGEGLVFAARLETVALDGAREMLREPALKLPPDRSIVTLLVAEGYFVKTPENTGLLTKMEAGIAAFVSIGFSAGSRVRLVGSDGIEMNAWRWVGPGEAHEMSLVWLGAQPGARAIKQASPRKETTDMDPIQKPSISDEQLKTLRDEHQQFGQKAAKFDAVAAALGDANAKLLDNPAEIASLVAAGKAHRDELVERLVADDRQRGQLGDDEASVKAAREEYAAMSIAALKRLAARIDSGAHAAPAPGITGGDPNAAKTAAGTDATKGVPSVIAAATLI